MPIYTVGHSNHTPEQLFSIIGPFRITHIIDIRSVPYSGRFPYFNKDNLKTLCEARNYQYEWRGGQLGGFRDEPDNENSPDSFQNLEEALENLIADFKEDDPGKTACLICAEKDPSRCHRSKLLGPALLKLGVDLHHILSDGTLIKQSELSDRSKAPNADRSGTLSLFD